MRGAAATLAHALRFLQTAHELAHASRDPPSAARPTGGLESPDKAYLAGGTVLAVTSRPNTASDLNLPGKYGSM